MAPETIAPPRLQAELENGFAPKRILSLGKAALSMARASSSVWPGVPGLLYSTVDLGPPPSGFLALCGDHPFPSAGNLARTAQVRAWLESSCGPLLAMVSGGASSLLVEPRAPYDLERTLALARSLWREGATIREVNTVRARLSAVKCGGLLTSVRGPAITAVWSDVGPRDAPLVGSGPTLRWRRGEEAGEVLARYGVLAPCPLPPRRKWERRREDRWFLLCDALRLRSRCAARLARAGYAVREVPCPEGTPVESVARRLTRAFLASRNRPWAVVGVGEPLVRVPRATGRGGRCSHLAALVALEMAASRARSWAFVALATDGVDGSGGGGAFCAPGRTASEEALKEALARGDTAGLWRREGCLLPAAPTGNNLRDLWVLADLEASGT